MICIGDYLRDKASGNLCKVVAIDGDKIKVDTLDNYYPIDSFEPIPLTREFFQANGFHCANLFKFYCNGDSLSYIIEYEGSVLTIKSHRDNIASLIKNNVQYVHELQQAFNLCGIEFLATASITCEGLIRFFYV